MPCGAQGDDAMLITPGMILLGYLVYLWFSQPPQSASSKAFRQEIREANRAHRQHAAQEMPDTPDSRQYLWIALSMVAFVVLSLLAHALVPR
jgi:hypothetical protein